MRLYTERLGVPVVWWLVAVACVVPLESMLGTTLWLVVGPQAALASCAVVVAAAVALLYCWGATTVEVTESELRAGSRVLPISAIGETTALDQAQTRALRGPQANPAAYLLIRPYLAESVYVEIAGLPRQLPYWLICSRAPAALALAIEDARRRAGGGTWDDAPGGHPPTSGRARRARRARRAEPAPADAADPRKESNAR